MIECYYGECEHHWKEEPFCKLNSCVASYGQIIEFQVARREYLTEVARHNMVNLKRNI